MWEDKFAPYVIKHQATKTYGAPPPILKHGTIWSEIFRRDRRTLVSTAKIVQRRW